MLKRLNKTLLLAILIFYDVSSAAAVHLQNLNLEKFDYVMSDKSPITVLFIFTSWCRVCKNAISDVLDMSNRYDDSKVRIIMLSLDEDIDSLKNMLKNYELYDSKLYYFNNKVARKDISVALFKNRIRYHGTIPHITIFHKDKVIADDSYDIQSVKNFIHLLYEKDEEIKR